MNVDDTVDYKIKDLYFPAMLLGKLTMTFTCEINVREEKMLSNALILITKQFERENMKDFKRTTLVFTENGDISLKMPSEAMGMRMTACIFPVKRWRDKNYNDIQILTIILEELCHHYWSIEDELIVKYKVFEVIKSLNPDLKITDLYTGLEEYEGYQANAAVETL